MFLKRQKNRWNILRSNKVNKIKKRNKEGNEKKCTTQKYLNNTDEVPWSQFLWVVLQSR